MIWLSGPDATDAARATGAAGATGAATATDASPASPAIDPSQVFVGDAHHAHKHVLAVGEDCAGLREQLARAKSELEEPAKNANRYEEARTAVSPFNSIGDGGLFQNRAALKLAELCALFAPLAAAVAAIAGRGFLDLCGGPGGFAEYLYWRLDGANAREPAREPVRGWGVTLASHTGRTGTNCDYRFSPKSALARSGTFVKIAGADNGSGDLLNAAVRAEIVAAIAAGTGDRGVPVVVADGGIDVEGQWDRQDEVTRRLVASQCAVATKTLARGGVFVCKMFGATSDFIAQLLAVLDTVFERVAVCKPVQSRSTNSEMYVVCCGFAGLPAAGAVAALLERLVVCDVAGDQTVNWFGPNELLDSRRPFVGRLQAANAVLMRAQIAALQQLLEHYRQPRPQNEAAIAAACRAKLREWGLPVEHFERRRLGGRGGGRGNGRSSDRGNRGRFGPADADTDWRRR